MRRFLICRESVTEVKQCADEEREAPYLKSFHGWREAARFVELGAKLPPVDSPHGLTRFEGNSPMRRV